MKLDVTALRYLSRDDFAVLKAIEVGSRNHEVVPLILISRLSKLRPGGLGRIVGELQRLKLVTKEASLEGVILGYGGYDYLALRTLAGRGSVQGVGRQIGVGKESDIYEVSGATPIFPCVIKLQRLGRTSFRTVKNNRDYIGKRQHYSWLYLSKLATEREFAFMQALHQHGFPVPIPIDSSRHVIVMQQIIGIRLDELRIDAVPGETEEEKTAFLQRISREAIDLVIRLAQHGLIHGDLNEFNMLIEEGSERLVMIDFPQMVSIRHASAEEYFQRDFNGIAGFFERKFGMEPVEAPLLSDIIPDVDLDKQLNASGSKKKKSADDDSSNVGAVSEGEVSDEVETDSE